MAVPFCLALVEKFSHGRPKIEEIRHLFLSLDLKQEGTVGHLDARHVLIHLSLEHDFHRV